MALDYLKRLLDRNGIDGWDLRPLVATDGGEVVYLTCRGSAAQDVWRRLREVVPQTGHWPVILGSTEELTDLDDQVSRAAPVSEVLKFAASLDGARLLRQWHEERLSDLADNNEGVDPEEFLAPEGQWPDQPQPHHQFVTPFDSRTRLSHRKVAVALVPTQRSWEAPAFLGFGGWNACPQPAEHCAVLARWNQLYGAELACLTRDVIELWADRPPTTREAAMALAREQFDYCEDIIDQGAGTLSNLAAGLLGGTAWYFWWD